MKVRQTFKKVFTRTSSAVRFSLRFLKKNFAWIVFLAAVAFATWLMCSTFGFENGKFVIKAKLLSDFHSHIAVIRSFSEGNNFPPEFPHFAGVPIRYHFLFYLWVALLEMSGVRLDIALNVLSIIGMVGLIMSVYFLGTKLGKSKWIGLGATIMLLFNSSLSWLYYFFIGANKLANWQDIFTTRDHAAFGPYNDTIISAFWNLNIYTNQRHLAFSFALLFLAVWLIVYRKGWKSLLAAVLVIGVLSWLHKAVWLILFIVLGVMFLSQAKKRSRIYMITLIGLALSLPALYFMNQKVDIAGASGVGLTWQPGFLYNATTWKEFTIDSYPIRFVVYWFLNMGLVPLLAATGFMCQVLDYHPKYSRKHILYWTSKLFNPKTAWFLAGLAVFIIANLVNFGPDIANNHKLINFVFYIWSIYALLAIKELFKVFSYPVLLLFPLLIIGGVCDLFPILNDVNFDLFSPETVANSNWIRANTKPGDVFLNFTGDMTYVLAAGRKEYLGGPYYAWSMGYPYDTRADEVRDLKGKNFPQTPFCKLLKDNNLSYVTYSTLDPVFLFDEKNKFTEATVNKEWGSGTRLKEGVVIFSTDNICAVPVKGT